MFDRLTVAVLRNSSKEPLFAVDERMAMLREAAGHLPGVGIESFEGLLVRYAVQKGATVIVRGIRAVSDYEYELQMAQMNRRLEPSVETVFLMAGEGFSFVSSRLVKEVYHLGGDIGALVPAAVAARLRQKI